MIPLREFAIAPESGGKPVISFLRFRGSRAGLFYGLSAREFCPLRHSPPSVELRFPPHISHEKTAPSRQSLRKEITVLPTAEAENCFFTHKFL
jgi:hypothetical protein